MNQVIYLDYNATTPIAKEVADTMVPYLYNDFGNPSSSHAFGKKAKKAIDNARMQLAKLINCSPTEIVFTSGGTESNNMAIKGIALANKSKGNHIITTAIEHPAVFEVCNYLQSHGFRITKLPVSANGVVSVADVEDAICESTVLITVMHANNEVGAIQPIQQIGKLAKKYQIAFHTDAAQSVGKTAIDVKAMNLDLLSIAGHKLYAPKGVGALYVHNGIQLEKFMHGANHEFNLRAGTENVVHIVGLGKASEVCRRDFSESIQHMANTRNYLLNILQDSLPNIRVNSNINNCLPNTLSIGFEGVKANQLVESLTLVAASAGAACHTNDVKISTVLTAMQVPVNYAMGTVRFSTGHQTTMADIKFAASEIIKQVNLLRGGN